MIEGVVKVVEGPAQRLSGTQGSVCRVCRQKRIAEPAKQFRHGHARVAIAKIHRRIVKRWDLPTATPQSCRPKDHCAAGVLPDRTHRKIAAGADRLLV